MQRGGMRRTFYEIFLQHITEGDMAQPFKVGDAVYLKSGAPKMVIKNFISATSVYCQWFSGNKLDNGVFSPESLVPEDPNTKVVNTERRYFVTKTK